MARGFTPHSNFRRDKFPDDGLLFVMVGNPNVGKTTLINAVSGANLRIGNWPGTTVERMDTHFMYHYRPGAEREGHLHGHLPEDPLEPPPEEAPETAVLIKKGAETPSAAPQATPTTPPPLDEEGEVHVHLVDLPGAYGLTTSTAEETLTRDELLTRMPDAVIDVVDAGNLERNLALTIELIELGVPIVIALNLLDEAQAKGMKPNVEALAKALDVPVVPTVAVREEGVQELIQQAIHTPASKLKVEYPPEIEAAIQDLASYLETPAARWLACAALVGDDLEPLTRADRLVPSLPGERGRVPIKLPSDFLKKVEYYRKKFAEEGIDCFLKIADSRYRLARKLANLGQTAPAGTHRLTQAIDRWVLHPLLGIPVFLLGMLILFRFTFLFSQPWVDWLEVIKNVLIGWTQALALPAIVRSFIVNGLLEGVGTVMAFTPVLIVLYAGMSFLESSGFLARSAFLIDRLMKGMGLPGKAFLPLLIGFGCNVPGIVATKTLESPSDRLRVALAVPFAPCSVRMAVFAFLAAIFFPNNAPYALFFIFILGLLAGLITILLLGKFMPQEESGSIMELPPYRIPPLKIICKQSWARTLNFLQSAGGAILVAVILVWALNSFPAGDLQNTYFARISRAATYFTSTFGVQDWHLAGALIPGFVAKEVVIGSLAVSYFGAGPEAAALTFFQGLQEIGVGLGQALVGTVHAFIEMFTMIDLSVEAEGVDGLSAILQKAMSPSAALAYMTFILLYLPCVGTLFTIKAQFGWKWVGFSCLYTLLVAWIGAVCVYHLPLGRWLAG